MKTYSPAEIEAKWQAAWAKSETFKALASADRPKYYVLEMFPYPSGRIHMGHVRNYTMGDVVARYKLSTGHNVLHPMGMRPLLLTTTKRSPFSFGRCLSYHPRKTEAYISTQPNCELRG